MIVTRAMPAAIRSYDHKVIKIRIVIVIILYLILLFVATNNSNTIFIICKS